MCNTKNRLLVLYPKELFAFVADSFAKRGQYEFRASDVVKFLPLLPQQVEGVSTEPISYATMAYGVSSPELNDLFEYLRLEGIVVHYDPPKLTPYGRQYCEKIVKDVKQAYPQTAKALTAFIETRCDQLR